MIQAVVNAFKLPDLRKKIIFTMVILLLYRLAAHIPIPGADVTRLRLLFENNQLLGLLDVFSGGAMANFSVIAMGVYPYITAQIILQLLMPLIPKLEQLYKEGEEGQRKFNRYTHYLTVPMAALNAFGQLAIMRNEQVLPAFDGSLNAWLLMISSVVTMTAGTIFAVWLGELISERGIGNGVSIIIFGGIAARIPQSVGRNLVQNPWTLVFFVLVTIITVAVIVIVQEGQRRIPVQYGKRVLAMRGNRLRMAGGQSTHIPIRVNTAGMIPLIFAQSFMIFPGTIASYFVYSQTKVIADVATVVRNVFSPQGAFYWVMYFFLVIGFTYFYTDVVFRQQNLPDVLQRQGGFVPGIRPGKKTEEYLNGVVQRITLVGALFLAVVAILPFLVRDVTETGTMLITSTGLLIVVGVVLDTMKQLEAQLLMRHYEGFIK
jgi:preprotein translocase subunit SecY